jgi:hypothetical protein
MRPAEDEQLSEPLDGKARRFRYAEPFAYLFGSHKKRIVEVRGVEPLASAVRRPFRGVS